LSVVTITQGHLRTRHYLPLLPAVETGPRSQTGTGRFRYGFRSRSRCSWATSHCSTTKWWRN